jgi:CheY-like chemotaxis protein
MSTASSAEQGLKVLRDEGPFALVISDMRMPGMNGAEFLRRVRQESPQSVRMILSGQADLQATIAAVNEGYIFRFLSKPCPPEQLLAAIQSGFEQYRLIRSEKVLLEETLSGSVRILIEILGFVSPASSSRASRLQRYVLAMATSLRLGDHWQWPLAALLSQIGCVALPKEVLSRFDAGQALDEDERHMYDTHPEVAGRLLAAVPRLEDVAAIVAAQAKPVSNVLPRDGDIRATGHTLLYAAREFDRLILTGIKPLAATDQLLSPPDSVPPEIVQALLGIPLTGQPWLVRRASVRDLSPGMILDEDLISSRGMRIVPEGSEVTRTLIIKLMSIADGVGIAQPFRVRVQT